MSNIQLIFIYHSFIGKLTGYPSLTISSVEVYNQFHFIIDNIFKKTTFFSPGQVSSKKYLTLFVRNAFCLKKKKKKKNCNGSRLSSGTLCLPPLSSFHPQSNYFLPHGCKMTVASAASRPLTRQEGERTKGNSHILVSPYWGRIACRDLRIHFIGVT